MKTKGMIGVVMVLMVITGRVFAGVPVAVSPGSGRDEAVITQECPTFSWSGVEGAVSYSVAVFEMVTSRVSPYEEMKDKAEPVLSVEIGAPALSWTPSSEQGLVSGGRYVWYVRGVDSKGEVSWSEGRVFMVDVGASSGMVEVVESVVGSTVKEYFSKEWVNSESFRQVKKEITAETLREVEKQGLRATPIGGGYEGSTNTFYGTGVGANTTGDNDYDTFIGAYAGYSNTAGEANTFLGYAAGYWNTTGTYNTFLGKGAGFNTTTGAYNTFVGRSAGVSHTIGVYNTFLGHGAGGYTTTGYQNTFLGEGAGYYNNTGNGNVFLGFRAGYNETGSNKLYIDNSDTATPLIYGEFDNNIVTINGNLNVLGTEGRVMLNTNSFDAPSWAKLYGAANNNNIGFAFDSFGTDSALGGGGIFRFARGSQTSKAAVQNGDRLGFFVFSGYDGTNFLNTAALTAKVDGPVSANSVPTKLVFETNAAGYPRPERMVISSSGNVGIGTPTPSYPLHMGSGAYVSVGGVWTDASSRQYKENIKDLTTEEAIEALEGLHPIKYNYKTDKEDRHVGFISEEVPDLIATKDRKGLSPMDIVAVLTKVVQEQQKTISELSEEVKELKRELRLRATVTRVDLTR